MDSFEFNKMAGALLGSLLFLMGLGIFSDAIFAPAHNAKPGYALPAGDDGHGHGGAAVAATAPSEPLPVLLAKADPKKGENLAKACLTCHSFDASGTAKPTGPNLYGVFGHKAGAAPEFTYSDGMKAAGITWDAKTLDTWIKDPKGMIAGTKMTFPGIKDDKDRTDLIAYLKVASSGGAN